MTVLTQNITREKKRKTYKSEIANTSKEKKRNVPGYFSFNKRIVCAYTTYFFYMFLVLSIVLSEAFIYSDGLGFYFYKNRDNQIRFFYYFKILY